MNVPKIFIPSRFRRQQGGWAAVPYIIMAVAAGGAAVMQRNAGIATQNAAAMQGRVEGDAAKQREIERRRSLITALSSQNAAAAASGVEMSGSLGGIARRNIKDAQNDLLVNQANVTSKQSALDTYGSNARAQGNLGAAVSLLDSAASGAKMWGGGGGGSPPPTAGIGG